MFHGEQGLNVPSSLKDWWQVGSRANGNSLFLRRAGGIVPTHVPSPRASDSGGRGEGK